ncbi:hypothetical protein [Desulfosporosinus lacus]|uniref:Uncharacterized protein n=1 Tax=Desulfosporosinus lacus DSM 15449 TaxID=1121420 RepID=A0A1M5V6L8_9FIRM|nr:hypothetical protein [Desulfosporosinus lacus]SHH70553.1 hypothetical protein SAMN02746098_01210 [Desulfosporosinus lacus DSM 15449]
MRLEAQEQVASERAKKDNRHHYQVRRINVVYNCMIIEVTNIYSRVNCRAKNR